MGRTPGFEPPRPAAATATTTTMTPHTQTRRLLALLRKERVSQGTRSWSALSSKAQAALRLFFIKETASTFESELRCLLNLGFDLAQSASALSTCSNNGRSDDYLLESSFSRLIGSDAPLPTPSAAFRGRVTELLRSGEYVSDAERRKREKTTRAERTKILKILRAAAVRDGTTSWAALKADAKSALSEHFISQTVRFRLSRSPPYATHLHGPSQPNPR